MKVTRVPWLTWLKYVGIGIAAVVLFVPVVVLGALYELGRYVAEEW